MELLFKNGEAQKANLLKEKTIQLKEVSKDLTTSLDQAVTKLQQLLFTIPNIPNELVPAGTDENDNEEVFKEGAIPVLAKGALPHWELAKKYDIIDFELGRENYRCWFPCLQRERVLDLQRALICLFFR